jgi:hypothetical protein
LLKSAHCSTHRANKNNNNQFTNINTQPAAFRWVRLLAALAHNTYTQAKAKNEFIQAAFAQGEKAAALPAAAENITH